MTSCPYASSKYHTHDADSCIVTPSFETSSDSDEAIPNVCYHTFVKAKYSIHPTDGKPLFEYLQDYMKTFIRVKSFEINSNRCTLTSGPFDSTKFKHLLSYRAETVLEYWSIIYNFKETWIKEMRPVQNKVFSDEIDEVCQKIWPSKYSALDILVDRKNSNSWKLLRPVAFTVNPVHFRLAVRHLMYQLFCNSLEEQEICWSSRKKRPKNMKCDDEYCKMYSTSSVPFYNVFGKGNVIHSIVCIPSYCVNDEWWNLTNAFINYRLKAAESNIDGNNDSIIFDTDDNDEVAADVVKSVTINNLRHLHTKFRNSIAQQSTNETVI